jgi:Pyruvate/2-oxoacid:ferredoxin oxidoreductase delta subunit
MYLIQQDRCTRCCGCIDYCPEIAMSLVDDSVTIDEDLCIECDNCVDVCPTRAVSSEPEEK